MPPCSRTSSRSRIPPRTTIRGWTGSGLVSRQDDLDVVAADVDERRRQYLAPADLQLPDLGMGDGDEIPRLRHEVGDARAGQQVDMALDAVARGEDGDSGLRIVHGSDDPARFVESEARIARRHSLAGAEADVHQEE